ncbi:MAG TPA: threonine-phosphate decarboxylase CobD [Patescibacteria group bacterium]|nr:threonine-phosphate decarboxylase CobD [Patescibacteria group bacterium]
MKQPGSFEHGGNIYALLRQSGQTSGDVLDFSANINPLGMAVSVRQAIETNLGNLIHYPDPAAVELKQAISRHYQMPEECITAGNGAVELLYVLCHCRKPRRVLVTAPTFSEYERAARAAGAAVEYFTLLPEQGFSLDVAEILPRLSGVDMVFICNPNNPTGGLLRREQLEPLLIAAQKTGTMVVVDESFQDFLTNRRELSCRPLLAKYDHLVVVCSLTKFYAIPGLRLGFVLASPAWTRTLHGAKDPWNVNSLAQVAGVAALQDSAYQEQSRAVLAQAREELYELLLQIKNCRPYPPSVNYILLNIADSGVVSSKLRRRMAEAGVMIRDCANYPGLSADYVRVAVKLPEQNRKLAAVLQQKLHSPECFTEEK